MKTLNLYRRGQGAALVFLLLLALSALGMQAFAQAVDPRTQGPARIEFIPPNPQPGQAFEVRAAGRVAGEPIDYLSICQLTGGIGSGPNLSDTTTLYLNVYALLSPLAPIRRDCTLMINPLKQGRYKYILIDSKGTGIPFPPIAEGTFDIGTIVDEVTRPVPSLSASGLIALALLLGGLGYRYAQHRKINSLCASFF